MYFTDQFIFLLKLAHCPRAVTFFQALEPVILRAVSWAVYAILNLTTTADFSNVFLMVITWQSAVHPLISFVCLQSFRQAFYDILKKPLVFFKRNTEVHPKIFISKQLPMLHVSSNLVHSAQSTA